MFATEKSQRKLITLLYGLLTQEQQELAKIRFYSRICAVGGWFLVLVTMTESLQPHWPLWTIALTGVAGGLLCGFAVFFTTWLRQWPVIRPLVNTQAVQKAQREARPPDRQKGALFVDR